MAFFIFPGQQTSTHLSSRRSRRGANHLTRVHLRKLRERYGATATAKSVLIRDDSVDHLRDQIFRELLTYMMENSAVVYPVFELILITKNLERTGDHATNIAEDVIYIYGGRPRRSASRR